MDHPSQDHEQHFLKVFIAVFIVLTLFTLFCVAMARALAPTSDASDDQILNAALQNRIAPVGKVNTGEVAEEAAPAPSVALTGEELVAANCAACHISGVAGAPKSDDADAWAKRREAGQDALLASVINGKGAMPARAGTTLDDAQLLLAVQHLAGFESADSDGADAESAASEGANDAAASETPATDDTAATTEAAADSAGEAATAGTMVAGELTDKVKATVDGLCIGCHLAGVAGAPKIGDTEAWASRAEKGLEGMTDIVVKGQGAMPPRGGSTLTDEEIASAIQYLMSK